MLSSKYIEKTTIPPFDKEISEVINNYQIEGGGKTMVIGIENTEGNVYRHIYAKGMGTYIYITSEHTDIGLEDKLQHSIQGENGFDSLFVVSDNFKKALENTAINNEPTILDDISSEDKILKS